MTDEVLNGKTFTRFSCFCFSNRSEGGTMSGMVLIAKLRNVSYQEAVEFKEQFVSNKKLKPQDGTLDYLFFVPKKTTNGRLYFIAIVPYEQTI